MTMMMKMRNNNNKDDDVLQHTSATTYVHRSNDVQKVSDKDSDMNSPKMSQKWILFIFDAVAPAQWP